MRTVHKTVPPDDPPLRLVYASAQCTSVMAKCGWVGKVDGLWASWEAFGSRGKKLWWTCGRPTAHRGEMPGLTSDAGIRWHTKHNAGNFTKLALIWGSRS